VQIAPICEKKWFFDRSEKAVVVGETTPPPPPLPCEHCNISENCEIQLFCDFYPSKRSFFDSSDFPVSGTNRGSTKLEKISEISSFWSKKYQLFGQICPQNDILGAFAQRSQQMAKYATEMQLFWPFKAPRPQN